MLRNESSPNMNWAAVIILLLAVTAVLVVRRLALVSAQKACRYLDEGALVVDVRNPEEFSQGHVPGAINIPLSRLPESLGARVSDKTQVLLLHCLGGGRSALAKRLLRANGYARAYNLGSYRRAERIASASRRKTEPSLPHLPPSQ